MKDVIQKIRSGTRNLKLIFEAITQAKLSLDAAQNSLQSMMVVHPECTSVAVQTDPFLISSEGNEIVHDQTQTNDKTHVQHPFLKTSPQNNMKLPEQEEVCFQFDFEKAEEAMIVKWGGLARRALGGQGPKMFGLPCVKEREREKKKESNVRGPFSFFVMGALFLHYFCTWAPLFLLRYEVLKGLGTPLR